jgi:hypothetical protein
MLTTRLTKLYSDFPWENLSDVEWLQPPLDVTSSPKPKRRRPASAGARRRANKTTPKRFENWYSSAMSEHLEKKKRALKGLPPKGTSLSTQSVHRHAKKVSDEEFQRWYDSALRSKEVQMKHLKAKHSAENKPPVVYKKFDPDKFDQWYKTGLQNFNNKLNMVAAEKEAEEYEHRLRDQTATFDAEHFQTWYEETTQKFH